jgi:hypothetical protein
MTLRVWSFYDSATGLFRDQTFAADVGEGHAAIIPLQTPQGCTALEGRYDPLSQKFDTVAGAVVDYQPAQPSPQYLWNADTKRWVLDPTVLGVQQARTDAQAQIDRLEYKQGRAMRELLLDLAPKLPAVDQQKISRLQAIEDAIAALRAEAG